MFKNYMFFNLFTKIQMSKFSECMTGFHHRGNLPGSVPADSREGRLGKASLLHTPEPSSQDGRVSRHVQLSRLDLLHHGLHTAVSGPSVSGENGEVGWSQSKSMSSVTHARMLMQLMCRSQLLQESRIMSHIDLNIFNHLFPLQRLI